MANLIIIIMIIIIIIIIIIYDSNVNTKETEKLRRYKNLQNVESEDKSHASCKWSIRKN
jgi:FtsZ-interacting cell division protein ZipA